MKCHRRAPLRISDMRIAHGSGDAAMSENALHFRQVHAGLQQIGSAAVPKLMQTVHRYLRAARNGVNPVANRSSIETLSVAAHQQRALTAGSGLFQLVVT